MADLADLAKWVFDADEADLVRLDNVISARRAMLKAEDAFVKRQTLYVGDKVRLHTNIRPKKIAGRVVVIRKIEGDVYHVEQVDPLPDNSWQRFRIKPTHFDPI